MGDTFGPSWPLQTDLAARAGFPASCSICFHRADGTEEQRCCHPPTNQHKTIFFLFIFFLPNRCDWSLCCYISTRFAGGVGSGQLQFPFPVVGAGIWLCSVTSSFVTSSQGSNPPRPLQSLTAAPQNRSHKPKGVAAPSARRVQVFVSLWSQQKSDLKTAYRALWPV